MIDTFFDDTSYYTGPALTDAIVAEAQSRLMYRLPQAYVELLRLRNGGRPTRRCYRTSFPTTWALDHFQIEAIRGLGGPWGIDTPGALSSSALIKEWGYPPIGIVLCDMPSGGHDAVMLDYSVSAPEPAVVYVDEDRAPRTIAPTFSSFVDNLVSCEELASR